MIEATTLQVAGFGLACVGAVLGVINTWHLLDRRRVVLHVRPKKSWKITNQMELSGDRPSDLQVELEAKDTPWRWAIEVTNRSAFPLSIAEVGFGRPSNKLGTCPIVSPEVSPGHEHPVRLEPRQSATFYARYREQPDASFYHFKCVYVRTDCGVTKYGSSQILREEMKRLMDQAAQTQAQGG